MAEGPMRRDLAQALLASACAPGQSTIEDEAGISEEALSYASSNATRTATFALTSDRPDLVFQYTCLVDAGDCEVTLRAEFADETLPSRTGTFPDGRVLGIVWASRISNGSLLPADQLTESALGWVEDGGNSFSSEARPVRMWPGRSYFSIHRDTNLVAEEFPSLDGKLVIQSRAVVCAEEPCPRG